MPVTLMCEYPPCSKVFTLQPSVYRRRQLRSPRSYCSPKCSALDRMRHHPRPTIEARLWAQLTVCEHGKTCETCCWEWQGWKSKGYGKMYVLERDADTGIHIIAWFVEHGIWPTLDICHTCDNPPCGNIHHLFEGTAKDNADDMVRKGRHSSVTHPESIARGDRNGSRKHPDRLARGDRNGTHLYPERLARGETNKQTKLTDEQRAELLRLYHEEGWTQYQLAERYGVSRPAIGYRIRHDPYP